LSDALLAFMMHTIWNLGVDSYLNDHLHLHVSHRGGSALL
jgi:hypothetical protein